MNRFSVGWRILDLPIVGKVAVIDHGECAVGLSAMQLTALNIHSGIVQLQFKDRVCSAKVWNAYGMNATRGYDAVRITDGVAVILGCKVGDDIEFTEVINHTLPVTIGPIASSSPVS